MTPGTPMPAKVRIHVAEGMDRRSAWQKSTDLTQIPQLGNEDSSLRTIHRSSCLVMLTSRSGWLSIPHSMAERFKTGMLRFTLQLKKKVLTHCLTGCLLCCTVKPVESYLSSDLSPVCDRLDFLQVRQVTETRLF